jgi:hypothetical protein
LKYTSVYSSLLILTKSYFLSSSKPIPKFIEPIKTDMAMELISGLISDLKEKFLTELTLPTEEEEFEDTACDSNDIYSEIKIIVLSGSHASRLAASLDHMDLDVVDLSTPCWSLSEASVHKLAAQLETVVTEDTEHNFVVIYHLFENSIFYGTGTQPFRDPDGRYHVEGALQIADRPAFTELFNMAVPLQRAGG